MSDITAVTFRKFLREPKECLKNLPVHVICRDRESFFVVRNMGDVAQSAEHGVVNAKVGGSKPPVPAKEEWGPYVPFYERNKRKS